MKKRWIFFFLIINSVYAQPPGQWMWIHGSSTSGAPANWGTQGVPSPTNVPPAVYEPCQWTDLNGNFWLFGGLAGGSYAALWKYDPLTNQWTWIKGPTTTGFAGNFGVQGVPAPTNLPPSYSYGVAAWVDLQGNFWLFGGLGGGSALWRYEIATNNWTWMKGPSTTGNPGIYGTQTVPDINNNPGGRWECVTTWTDNAGDLWMFGGYSSGGVWNDLWRFNIATNTWTWMKGSTTPNQPGVYGTLNVEDPANTPGGRMSYTHWKDNAGNLWMLGGCSAASTNYNNDMWKYNPLTNNWTWMGGSNFNNSQGVYGSVCNASSANTPGARFENRSVVTDQNGNFWLFGGGSGGSFNNVWNDLWLYCVSSNQWIWQSGGSTTNPVGNWGTINVPSATNVPNGRGGAVAWYDGNYHIYIFGGSRNPFNTSYNDLWRYTVDPNCYPCNTIQQPLLVNASNNTSVCEGGCTNISATASGGNPPYTYSWTPNVGTGPGPHQVCPAGTTTYYVTATDSTGNTATDSVTVTVNPFPVIITSSPASICVGDQTVLTAAGASTYSWLPCANLNPCTGSAVTASPVVTTPYTVTGTDANGCSATASVTVTVNPLPLVVSPPAPAVCSGGSVVLTMSGAASYAWQPQTGLSNPNGPDSTTVTATVTSSTNYTVTGYSAEGCSVSITFTVAVLPDPIAVITPDGPLSFCEGGQVTLTASGGVTFLWYDNSTSASIAVNTSGTYMVTVTDTNGCSGSTSETVTVNPNPLASLTPNGNLSLCNVPGIMLNANTGPGLTYEWYLDSVLIPLATTASYFATLPGSYQVKVIDAATGCFNWTEVAVLTQTGNGPVVTITSSPTIGCLQNTIYVGYGPQSVTLTANSVPPAASYLWSTNETTQSISITSTGIYSVTAYDSSGCASASSPESQFSLTVVDIRCGQGKKKIILCHVPEGNPGNPQTICVAPSAIPHHLALHQYDCLGPCSLYYQRQSLFEEESMRVSIYPNPFSNSFVINVENGSGETVHLNLFDVTGRLIISDFMFSETAELGENLKQGVYNIDILIGEKKEVFKLVKL